MTRLGDDGDDPARSGDDGPEAAALEIARAVDSLAVLWSSAAQAASLRLSPHQLRCLRVLEAVPGLNLTALADRMDIGLPTASRLCDRLEAAGLLERVLHPRKRREVKLTLTARGRRLLTEVTAERVRALTTALARMDDTDRAELVRVMGTFLRAQERREPGNGPGGETGPPRRT
ncbi:MarR family transcriptional regulator [Streptomyces sp. LP11]|uniref:MarR family transcriptional regulator n=1 Tax=Streptomyces pyxinicus TaxID=2970331 RepID=A0ABT2B3M8_9ACTN|nr:MarR family transcriptional regulator [Streptomyces sp. LP11]MCS0603020.1 MarR family transcriptional regulator [Streptomyces sp. LP11]